MRDVSQPKVSKTAFFLADALLLGAACIIYVQSRTPLGPAEAALAVLCVAGGALLAIVPFLLEYRAVVRLAEAGALTTLVSQVRNLEAVATQIAHATSQWQTVQEQAGTTASGAKEIADRMSAEARAFTEFMQRANDSEKATLKLEVEKLRRAENDWLQVMVRMLDHVFALNQGALRSGQPSLIEQLGNFQNACRDAARRVGLAPFTAHPAEAFDAQRHRSVEDDAPPAIGARVAETVAAGYTFQGRMLRPALVRLGAEPGEGGAEIETTDAEAVNEGQQNELRLETVNQ